MGFNSELKGLNTFISSTLAISVFPNCTVDFLLPYFKAPSSLYVFFKFSKTLFIDLMFMAPCIIIIF
jgi:hypothetical protein